jgi:hypothetical protein
MGKRRESEYTLYEYSRTKDVRIYHSEVLDMAETRGDYRSIEEMDDGTFYNYCETILWMRDQEAG